MANTYTPNSCFFCDPGALAPADSANYGSDAFGPVTGNETTQFRTTSIVRAIDNTTKNKVYAICKGKISIQPNADDDTKVNLVLKPDANYAPLKIKYFIYRGVGMNDILTPTTEPLIADADPTNPDQPAFVQKIWAQYIALNTSVASDGPSALSSAPSTFPASLIGYLPSQSPDVLLDEYFSSSSLGDDNYQIADCLHGEFIGNFVGSMGLDIVLDQGDSLMADPTSLFNLDLNFTQSSANLLDTTTISSPDSLNAYQEYIHQFLDAAAFWGSHINCGNIQLNNYIKPQISSNADVYSVILQQYQTSSKVYLYAKGERGRSYNFYDTTRTLKFITTTDDNNTTSGWPILIKDESVPSGTGTNTINLNLQYSIDPAIDQLDRTVYLDLVVPNNNTVSGTTGQNITTLAASIAPGSPSIDYISPIALTLQCNNSKYCAAFVLVSANLTLTFPLPHYTNDLWPLFDTSLSLPASPSDLSYWSVYDKNLVKNLSPQLPLGVVVQNKLYKDTGTDATGATKDRRLYMAVIKNNSNPIIEFNKLNVTNLSSGVSVNGVTMSSFAQNVFKDTNFSVYLGKFTDVLDSNHPTVNSLSLIHADDFNRKKSYLLLGITDDEYSTLTLLPEFSTAQNIFFDLADVSNPNITTLPDTMATSFTVNADILTKNFKKYQVGLIFEDSTGALSKHPVYPTGSDAVFVYTVDGNFYFSETYSKFQNFYNQFADATVEFRTQSQINSTTHPVYLGQFFFDWLRVGDNGFYAGTVCTDPEPSYQDTIISGYHLPVVGDLTTEYTCSFTPIPPLTSAQVVAQMAFKALKREYAQIPTKFISDVNDQNKDQYFIQSLNLFPKNYVDTISSNKPPFSAELRVFVNIFQELSNLTFDYNSTYFSINVAQLPEKTPTGGKVESAQKTIIITCLYDFAEDQQIRVLAVPANNSPNSVPTLAGIINVGRNSVVRRNTINIILVNVRTNISGTPNTGSFTNAEVFVLNNSLNQDLYMKLK
jgi:hypothetical protein